MNLAEQMQSLYAQVGNLRGITVELHQSLIAIGIRNQAASATVFLQGAQVTHYQRHNQPPIIWLSPECEYTPGKSLRGGIPICWPWFGDLKRNPEAIQQQVPTLDSIPAHGFVRDREWTLDSIEQCQPDLTRVVLSLNPDGSQEPLWPFSCRLIYELLIGESLTAKFSVANLSSAPFSYTTALHTYFDVNDVTTCQIDGLEGMAYLDTLADWQQTEQQSAITINAETDRLYLQAPQQIRLTDPGHDRTITISSQTSNSCIVWNPWIEKAKRLSAFPDSGYTGMVCIETAKVMDDCVTLAPGESYTLDMALS